MRPAHGRQIARATANTGRDPAVGGNIETVRATLNASQDRCLVVGSKDLPDGLESVRESMVVAGRLPVLFMRLASHGRSKPEDTR